MHFRFNNSNLKRRRQDLRNKSTEAEKVLWQRIRNKKLGHKILRQYSVEGYVIDFYCPEKRLAIEIDGGYHNINEVIKYDIYRQRLISAYNINFLRFKNNQITSELDTVLAEIVVSLS